MLVRKLSFLIPIGLGILLLAGFFLLLPATQVKAQCGSQASSCKNCHETQGQKSVNNDGTGWHTGHAFGDFCYACHGGNNQSMDKAAAHTGMVPPMSDIKTACQSCHPNDLTQRAQKYADALGIKLTEGSQPSTSQATPSGATATSVAPAGTTGGTPTGGGTTSSGGPAAPSAPGLVVGSQEVVDYNQQYAQTVEGQVNINWGNVILAVLIVLVVAGGAGFVFANERKLRGQPLFKTAAKAAPTSAELPKVEGYSADVVALLPLIAKLNPMGLHSLKRVLENPDQANELLHSLAMLDPELVKRIRSLDRESRELLLALAG